jgi:hypothetical protein
MSENAPNSILLYRYLDSAAGLKTIESRSFKVGRIRDFNDPFEWRLGIKGIIPEGEPFARAWVESFIDHMNNWLGIFCFSDTASEPVLWSHYADKHRGVAFEVNYTIDPDKLIKIAYTDRRPVIDANRSNDPDGGRSYLKPYVDLLIKQKSSGWSYEREYRAFVDLVKDCEISGGLYFRRIPEDFLTRVILGYKCPFEEKYVLKALEKVGLTSTKVVRARMCLETYSIRFD